MREGSGQLSAISIQLGHAIRPRSVVGSTAVS
jgi:hypothetical protein